MSLRRFGILAVVALGLAASGTAQAQFSEEEGFFLFLDTIFTTPQNTDQVIATINTNPEPLAGELQSTETVLVDWGGDPAGRLQFGYRWANGSMVSLTYWGYEADQRTMGNGPFSQESGEYAEGGVMYFGIGPTIHYPGLTGNGLYGFGPDYGYYGYPGGHYDIVTEIKAHSLEIEAGRGHDLSDAFNLEWSVGLRWADFEENLSGFYDTNSSEYVSSPYYSVFGDFRYAANKTNESSMVGLKVRGRGSYAFSERFSLDSSLGVSFLQGSVESDSGLVPSGAYNRYLPSSSIRVKDDDRSSTIVDFEINFVWHIYDDRYRVWAGYAYSDWDGMTVDLARKQPGNPGSQLAYGVRDGIVFSGFKIGVGFLF